MVCLLMSSLYQIVFEFPVQSTTHFIDTSLYLFIYCWKKYSKFKLDWMSAVIKAAVKTNTEAIGFIFVSTVELLMLWRQVNLK